MTLRIWWIASAVPELAGRFWLTEDAALRAKRAWCAENGMRSTGFVLPQPVTEEAYRRLAEELGVPESEYMPAVLRERSRVARLERLAAYADADDEADDELLGFDETQESDDGDGDCYRCQGSGGGEGYWQCPHCRGTGRDRYGCGL